MLPEPWLRADITDVDPLLKPVLYSFRMAQEDLQRFTEGLTVDEIWLRPYGLAPVGFHIRHIGGSVDRLLTYSTGGSLSEDQFQQLRSEMEPGPGREELLAELQQTLERCEEIVRRIDITQLTHDRGVGRQQLPTTVIGLLIHVAEHTQRHVGQAIVTAKLVKGMAGPPG
jgi:hypothetical protein